VHGARAAMPRVAADVRAGQTQVPAQKLDQERARVDFRVTAFPLTVIEMATLMNSLRLVVRSSRAAWKARCRSRAAGRRQVESMLAHGIGRRNSKDRRKLRAASCPQAAAPDSGPARGPQPGARSRGGAPTRYVQ
jgi:hypothetical protein